MRLIILTLFLFIYSVYSYSQQTPIFSEYNYSNFLINSAFSSLESESEIVFTSNGMLNNFEGASKSSTLTYTTSIPSKNIGLGFGIINDKIGLTNNTLMFGAFSYKIPFSGNSNKEIWNKYDEHVLSFGFSLGVNFFNENLLELQLDNDPNFNENIRGVVPYVGVGIVYNKAFFYAGLSSPNILGNILAKDEKIMISQVIYGYMGYRIYTNKVEDFMLKPNVLIKYEEGAPLQADINLALNYKNKLELGVGYRTTSSINFLVGTNLLKGMKLIYNYNQPINDYPINNTHGVILTYKFGKYGYSCIR